MYFKSRSLHIPCKNGPRWPGAEMTLESRCQSKVIRAGMVWNRLDLGPTWFGAEMSLNRAIQPHHGPLNCCLHSCPIAWPVIRASWMTVSLHFIFSYAPRDSTRFRPIYSLKLPRIYFSACPAVNIYISIEHCLCGAWWTSDSI